MERPRESSLSTCIIHRVVRRVKGEIVSWSLGDLFPREDSFNHNRCALFLNFSRRYVFPPSGVVCPSWILAGIFSMM